MFNGIKKAVDESTAFLNQLNLTTMNSEANVIVAIHLIKKSILKNVKTYEQPSFRVSLEAPVWIQL